MKKILIGIAAVVVIAVVAVFVLYSNIGSIIKAAVEEVGTRATKATVTLREVDLSATSGEGTLSGFTVGNPAGYRTASAMRLGEVKVKVDVGSITGDTVVINEVVIAGPQITYELGGAAGSNLQTIQKNVDEYAGAGQGGASTPAGGQPPKSEGGKKLIIENLYVRDGRIGVSAAFLAGQQMDVALPAIHLKDIGKDKGGATPAEVADQLMTAITASAANAVSKLPGMDKAMDAVKGGADAAKKMMEGGAEGAGKGLGGAVKGLFGSEKK